MFLKQIFLSEMMKKVVCFCFIKCTCVQKGPFSQLLATCYATIYYLPPWAWSERDSAQGHIASDKCHTTNGESMNWRWRSAHMTMHISLCQCCWMQTLNKQHDSVPPRRTCIGLHFIIDVAAKWAHLIEQIGPIYAALECLATMNPQDVLEVLADSLCGGCCECNDRHIWELLFQYSELFAVGAKIVPPLAAAVGLIDGNAVQPSSILIFTPSRKFQSTDFLNLNCRQGESANCFNHNIHTRTSHHIF